MSETPRAARAPNTGIRGLVAAAGRSTRMGRPKSLLPVPVVNVPLAIHLATVFLDAGANDVVITIPPLPDGTAVQSALAPHLARLNESRPRVHAIENQQWETGLIGSIRSALDHAPTDVDVLVFTPVDAPFASVPLVSALTAAASALDVGAAVPVVDGNRGHPVAISRTLFAAVREGEAPDGARGILAKANVAEIPWTDTSVCRNVNTPQAWSDAATELHDRLLHAPG